MKTKEVVNKLLEADPDSAESNMQRYNTTLSDAEKAERGRRLGEVLDVHKNRKGYWVTQWGTKTDLGMFLSAERILKDGDDI